MIFGAVGFALIFEICFGGGGHSTFSFCLRSSATGRIGCGPTTVVTGSAPSSSETDGPRFREGAGSSVSGYRAENTRSRADQSGRTVKSSLNTGFSIIELWWWLVGEVSDLKFEVSGNLLCFCYRGCHERRGVRINMASWGVVATGVSRGGYSVGEKERERAVGSDKRRMHWGKKEGGGGHKREERSKSGLGGAEERDNGGKNLPTWIMAQGRSSEY